jgi:hypothetical protein
MAGQTNYLRNKLIDWFHRGKSFTPPTSHFVALVTTTPTASAAGTEVTGTGYARQEIVLGTTTMAATNADGSTTDPSSGTTGKTSNNGVVNWGNAGSSWGTVSYYEVWDAVTGGNRLFFGAIVDSGGTPAPRSIANGDPVSFPISAMAILWG